MRLQSLEGLTIQDLAEQIQGKITDSLLLLDCLLAEVNPKKGSEAEGDISYVNEFNEDLKKIYKKAEPYLREIEGQL